MQSYLIERTDSCDTIVWKQSHAGAAGLPCHRVLAVEPVGPDEFD